MPRCQSIQVIHCQRLICYHIGQDMPLEANGSLSYGTLCIAYTAQCFHQILYPDNHTSDTKLEQHCLSLVRAFDNHAYDLHSINIQLTSRSVYHARNKVFFIQQTNSDYVACKYLSLQFCIWRQNHEKHNSAGRWWMFLLFVDTSDVEQIGLELSLESVQCVISSQVFR